ncbi:hemolysin-III related-domain-containing protein [Dichotomocladium elegans]|nr:hemolysin-III related-domain-containing protein [Dichotomocladium elegans]
MANLLTINAATGTCDEPLDMDTLFREQLAPLLQKFKYRLSQFEQSINSDSKRLQDYSRSKLKRVYSLLEELDEEWHHRWQACSSFADKKALLVSLKHTLEQSLADITDKYREFETTFAATDDYTLDDTIDAIMSKIEEIDSLISDAIDCAAVMGSNLHEKLNKASEHLKEAVAKGARQLLHYDELPVPWRNNEHIHTGYRFLSTPAQCWHSLLYLHNETGNIYTHLVGFVVFLGLGVYELFYSSLLTDAPGIDRVIFGIFFIAACKCLMCSTVWHTLSGINDYAMFKRYACLDYVGISVLICASVILFEYYGFYCHDQWRNTYMLGTGTLAVAGIIMPFMEWFDRHDMRWLRISFFIALAASAAVPIFHLYTAVGAQTLFSWLTPVSKSISCYLLGVVVYGNQWPEAFWPGKFDHIGHSHQLWHLFVCGGIWYHYTAAVSFFGQRQDFGLCPIPSAA